MQQSYPCEFPIGYSHRSASSSVHPPAAVAEIGRANARLAVVLPYVRHAAAAAAGRAQADQEETDDADAPAAARGNEVLLSNGEVTRKCLEVRLMRRYYGQMVLLVPLLIPSMTFQLSTFA